MSEDDFTGGDVVVAVYHQKCLILFIDPVLLKHAFSMLLASVWLRNSFGFKVKLGQVTFSLEKVLLGASSIMSRSSQVQSGWPCGGQGLVRHRPAGRPRQGLWLCGTLLRRLCAGRHRTPEPFRTRPKTRM